MSDNKQQEAAFNIANELINYGEFEQTVPEFAEIVDGLLSKYLKPLPRLPMTREQLERVAGETGNKYWRENPGSKRVTHFIIDAFTPYLDSEPDGSDVDVVEAVEDVVGPLQQTAMNLQAENERLKLMNKKMRSWLEFWN